MASYSVKQGYTLIAERCNVMLKSKYIMSSNCISSILKVVASVPCLTNYLVKCSQDFSFDAALEQATKTSKFILPEDSKSIVAFVTELLFKFDRKEIDLTKFIKRFYPEQNFEGSYQAFCQDVIAQYLMAFSTILHDEDVQDAQRVKAPILDAARTQVTQFIFALIELVTNDESLKDEKRKDIVEMLNGFHYAFEKENAKMIKVIWIGLKSIMNGYKKGVSYMTNIENILQTYAVI